MEHQRKRWDVVGRAGMPLGDLFPNMAIQKRLEPLRAARSRPIWEAEPFWAVGLIGGLAGPWQRLGWTAFGSEPSRWQH